MHFAQPRLLNYLFVHLFYLLQASLSTERETPRMRCFAVCCCVVFSIQAVRAHTVFRQPPPSPLQLPRSAISLSLSVSCPLVYSPFCSLRSVQWCTIPPLLSMLGLPCLRWCIFSLLLLMLGPPCIPLCSILPLLFNIGTALLRFMTFAFLLLNVATALYSIMPFRSLLHIVTESYLQGVLRPN